MRRKSYHSEFPSERIVKPIRRNYGDTLLFPRFVRLRASSPLARPQRTAELCFETIEKPRRAKRNYGDSALISSQSRRIRRPHAGG
jgi:hypothetical protein